MADVGKFVVLTRHLTSPGQLPNLTDHAPNTDRYTYVSSAISLAVGVMSTEACQRAMTRLALAFDDREMQSNLFQRDGDRAREAVQAFVNAVKSSFPIVCIDETMTGNTILACHGRVEWNGHFNPRHQWIFINGTVR